MIVYIIMYGMKNNTVYALVNWNPGPPTPGTGRGLTGEWPWINMVLMHHFPRGTGYNLLAGTIAGTLTRGWYESGLERVYPRGNMAESSKSDNCFLIVFLKGDLQSDLRMCTKEPTFYDTNSLTMFWVLEKPDYCFLIIYYTLEAWKYK
jgi:hypothetical protein